MECLSIEESNMDSEDPASGDSSAVTDLAACLSRTNLSD